MMRLALQTIRAKKARFVLTAVAVMLGVAFVAGTLVLTDTIAKAYDGIAATKYAGTDVVVRSDHRVVDADTNVTTRGSISASVLDRVRGVEGVASADGAIEGSARLVGRDGELLDPGQDQALPIALAWHSTGALNPLRLVSGHAPRAADEIVIDRASARAGTFAPGDTVRVLTGSGSAQYQVAGVATYGTADDAGGAAVVAFTPATAARVLGDPGRLDGVVAAATPGVTASELANRVRAELGDTNLQVITGTTAIREARDEVHKQMGFMSIFLMTFAIVAVIVGAFVIFNALSITVAQRTRENAMLRALGSTRGQVLRMVMLESLVIGVVASAMGTILGVGLAAGLRLLLESFGVELPQGAVVVAPRTIVVSMLVGTVVTLVAAGVPARKAARVAPIAALRDVAVDSSGRSTRRAVIGVVTSVVGAGLFIAGLAGGGAAGVAVGALALFAGVVVLGPVLAPRFVTAVGRPLAASRGMSGTIARDNAARNPKRTAATASALMIGVGLVVCMTVFAASARTSVAASVDQALRSDWIIDAIQNQEGLSPTVASGVDALPQTDSVASLRYTSVEFDGSPVQVAAVDPAVIERHVDFDLQRGTLAALGEHGVAVYQDELKSHGWKLGDEVVLGFPETGPQHFTIAAVYATSEPLGPFVVSQQAFDSNVAQPTDTFVMATDAPGTSTADARRAIDGVLATYPAATLHTPDEFKAGIAGEINKMLNLIYVLLFFAVVIALFGIANTLALSIVERKRELGLLRAVGMQRAQVRSAVRWEAALIGLFGTVVGTTLGIGFGWALVQSMADQGLDRLAIPALSLAVIATTATVAAVAAAVLPSRRAAGLGVLEAISS